MSPGWELLAFAGVMALGQFSPGPDMLLLTRTALARGARTGAIMAMGIATGLTLHAALAIGGLAWIFERVAWLRVVIHLAAAGYLSWLGFRLLREWSRRGAGSEELGNQDTIPGASAFAQGLWCNLLNPKVLVFLAAVTTPFLAGERAAWWPWALWLIVVIEGLVLWCLWVLLLQAPVIRRAYQRVEAWVTLGFGIALILLGIRLLLP